MFLFSRFVFEEEDLFIGDGKGKLWINWSIYVWFLFSHVKVTGRPDWEALLDAPTSAPAWPAVLRAASGPERVTPARVGGMRKEEEELGMMKGAKLEPEGEGKVRAALEGLTGQLISMEQRLNELDSGSGDGDCGSTLAAGAKAIQVRVKIYMWRKRNEVKDKDFFTHGWL